MTTGGFPDSKLAPLVRKQNAPDAVNLVGTVTDELGHSRLVINSSFAQSCLVFDRLPFTLVEVIKVR